jgi:diadenosine tetraphosphate (Ap4A) HIT family hydrolase
MPFCTMERSRVVASNSLAFAIRDGYPVSPGHTLAIPHRHVGSFFDLSPQEQVALFEIVREQKRVLDGESPLTPLTSASTMARPPARPSLVHVHLIPRFQGDVADPRGGIRWVLPAKSCYWTD